MHRKLLAPVLFLLLAEPAVAASLDCVGSVEVGTNGGSGTIIARSDTHCLILTCQHVATRRGYAATASFPGYNTVTGVVVKADRRADLALILVETPGDIRPAKLGATQRSNGPFYLMGYPEHDRSHVNWQKSHADVVQEQILIVGCAPIPGMSGGPTFDSRGYLVGVVVGFSRDPDFGVCIPSGEIFPFLLEFIEESEVSKLVPAAILAVAIANAPAETIPFVEDVPEEVCADATWNSPPDLADASKCGLFDRLRSNRRRTWQNRRREYRPQPRTQRVQPQVQPQQNCPNGQCPRPNTQPQLLGPWPQQNCPDGQCEPPRTERLDQGFRFQRRTPRREIEIEVAPEPTPAEPQAQQEFDLEIQVQDWFPPEEEHSILVECDPEPTGETSAVFAGLAALAGSIVAAYRTYVAA